MPVYVSLFTFYEDMVDAVMGATALRPPTYHGRTGPDPRHLHFHTHCIPVVIYCIPAVRNCIPAVRNCIPAVKYCIPADSSFVPRVLSSPLNPLARYPRREPHTGASGPHACLVPTPPERALTGQSY